MAIEALIEEGQARAAHARADMFRRQFPSSLLLPAVEAAFDRDHCRMILMRRSVLVRRSHPYALSAGGDILGTRSRGCPVGRLLGAVMHFRHHQAFIASFVSAAAVALVGCDETGDLGSNAGTAPVTSSPPMDDASAASDGTATPDMDGGADAPFASGEGGGEGGNGHATGDGGSLDGAVITACNGWDGVLADGRPLPVARGGE